MSGSRLLVLFDVDGTLFLTHDPLFGKALIAAVEDVYGLRLDQGALDRCDHPGQATLRILREVTGRDDRLADCCKRVSDRYLELLEGADTSAWEAAPRARETLDEIAGRTGIALLTGNPESVARARMERLGLARFFPAGQGAFGCDAERRVDLIALARRRAGDHPAEQTVTVGDTPNDVAGAHAAGVRCIAVATGRFPPDELAAADALVERLDELPRVVF